MTDTARKTPEATERHRVSQWLAQAAALQESDTRRAMALARRALARATRVRYTTGLAGALRQLGHRHFKLGEIHAALDCYGRGLAAARLVGSTAVAFGRAGGDTRQLYVTTNGGLFLPPRGACRPRS